MKEIYFKNAAETGILYLRHILYEFEGEPVLFLCTDDQEQIYFCLCTEIRYRKRWILAKSRISRIECLIEKEQDITSFFEEAKRILVIAEDSEGTETSLWKDIAEIDKLELPEEGTFLRCDRKRAYEFLRTMKEGMAAEQPRDCVVTFSIDFSESPACCFARNKEKVFRLIWRLSAYVGYLNEFYIYKAEKPNNYMDIDEDDYLQAA